VSTNRNNNEKPLEQHVITASVVFLIALIFMIPIFKAGYAASDITPGSVPNDPKDKVPPIALNEASQAWVPVAMKLSGPSIVKPSKIPEQIPLKEYPSTVKESFPSTSLQQLESSSTKKIATIGGSNDPYKYNMLRS
jgi:hypothetical protein